MENGSTVAVRDIHSEEGVIVNKKLLCQTKIFYDDIDEDSTHDVLLSKYGL